jgi:hypothetical protein
VKIDLSQRDHSFATSDCGLAKRAEGWQPASAPLEPVRFLRARIERKEVVSRDFLRLLRVRWKRPHRCTAKYSRNRARLLPG